MSQVIGEFIASFGHLLSQAKQRMQLRPQIRLPLVFSLIFPVGQSFMQVPQPVHFFLFTVNSLLKNCRMKKRFIRNRSTR